MLLVMRSNGKWTVEDGHLDESTESGWKPLNEYSYGTGVVTEVAPKPPTQE